MRSSRLTALCSAFIVISTVHAQAPMPRGEPQQIMLAPSAMGSLAALLQLQVQPCYSPPAVDAAAASITTVIDLNMNRDGSVASAVVREQSGIKLQNRAFASQMADAARRAVLRCSPFKLPPELYEGGWDTFAFRFRAQ